MIYYKSFSILKWVDIQYGQQANSQEINGNTQICLVGRIPAAYDKVQQTFLIVDKNSSNIWIFLVKLRKSYCSQEIGNLQT